MKKQAKIITVYPVITGNGAKFVATNIAHYLKQASPSDKIALVDFNLKQPYLAQGLTTHDEIHGLDNLIDKIDGNSLTESLFIENMVATKTHVEVLKGTKMIGKHKVYAEKHIQTVIQHLKTIYDTVIIAVAPETDNAGTIFGLHEADTIVMVARTNIANVKSMSRGIEIVNQYKKSTDTIKLVCNMHTNSASDVTKVAKEQGVEVIGLVESDDNAIDNLDLNGSQSVKLFKSKSKNQDVFTNIVKSL